ncbi:MAG: peptide chain release factor N(5)-glutamine methyltransferase [Dehalococcoidia bacterium]|nr:peptide chain release factor N(5)-glutamine methyltransferase [Dehalococcoidia bacterium]
MIFRELLANASAQLAAKGIEDARIEAEVLIMASTSSSRAWLYAHAEDLVSEDGLARTESFVRRRLLREPTAYIVGHKEFYGFDFNVDRRVLIPRPETELLVDEAIAASRKLLSTRSYIALADVGTGSGAVAISLARHLPNATVYATDLSSDALDVARLNCRNHGVEDRVELLQGDLLGPVDAVLDIIVANLPYVKDSDLAALQPEIREFEPFLALRGGKAGLDAIRRLLKQSVDKVSAGGIIALEIAWDQGRSAVSLARAFFPGDRIEVRRDLAGLVRLIVISVGGTEEVSS